MIQLQNVSKRYKTAAQDEFALRGVSLSIGEGELTAIVGTSGSGKTTLLNLIGGLDRSYEGVVSVGGQDLGKLSDKALAQFRNQHIGFVFQQFSLLDHRTVLENVLLPTHFAKGVDIGALTTRARETLTDLGLGAKINERPSNLSGGQKQRVAIARALLFKPKLLLCDEPTGSLDTKTGQQIIDLFGTLNDEGYTVVIITHEARVSEAARRVVRIEDGQIVDAGGAA
ncbi:MAG: ABC transporter ATP-binding protein [Bradymonadia bacterium]